MFAKPNMCAGCVLAWFFFAVLFEKLNREKPPCYVSKIVAIILPWHFGMRVRFDDSFIRELLFFHVLISDSVCTTHAITCRNGFGH